MLSALRERLPDPDSRLARRARRAGLGTALLGVVLVTASCSASGLLGGIGMVMLALGGSVGLFGSLGCKGCRSPLGPCLSMRPQAKKPDAHIGPCLQIVAPRPPKPAKRDAAVRPCLSVPPANATKRKPAVPVRPCLSVLPPKKPKKPNKRTPKKPNVHPCLAPPMSPRGSNDAPTDVPEPRDGTPQPRADILERLASRLPADVVARLRRDDIAG